MISFCNILFPVLNKSVPLDTLRFVVGAECFKNTFTILFPVRVYQLPLLNDDFSRQHDKFVYDDGVQILDLIISTNY